MYGIFLVQRTLPNGTVVADLEVSQSTLSNHNDLVRTE